jgi:hypothetical protein
MSYIWIFRWTKRQVPYLDRLVHDLLIVFVFVHNPFYRIQKVLFISLNSVQSTEMMMDDALQEN